jgi:endonuclease/exonuclease/phosphatase family metal-dependent hydrolase
MGGILCGDRVEWSETFFRRCMTALTLKGISLNIAGLKDTIRLMKIAGKSVPETTYTEIDEWYTSRIETAFKDGKLYGQDVDFFCLQELFPNSPEKKRVLQILLKSGFSIVGDDDLGIAYKTNQFVLKTASYTTSDTSGALYAILQHKASQEEVCLVSDHVAGFNAREQKTLTRAIKAKTQNNPLTNKPWQDDDKQAGPGSGDRVLVYSIDFLKQELSPNLSIWAGDFNATADYLKDRVHPKRMGLLFQAGWVCDTKDEEPTIVDHKLEPEYMQKDKIPAFTHVDYVREPKVALKYDYICAKTPWGHELSITSKALGPQPDQFAELFSDHRPVLATITMKKTWGSLFLSFYKFFRLLNLFSLCQKLFFSKQVQKESPKPTLFNSYRDLINDGNCQYLSEHGERYFELLVLAKVSADDLRKYSHDVGTTLDGLLSEKNKLTTYQNTAAQMSEFFVISCILNQFSSILNKDGIKLPALKNFAKQPKQFLTNLKNGLRALLKKESPQLAKVQRYIREQMKDATLLQEVTLWTADNIV